MNRKNIFKFALLAAVVTVVGTLLFRARTDTDSPAMQRSFKAGKPFDFSRHAATPPATPLRLLFIHHSCGGQLLAALGPDVGTNCIYQSHPNGGGLRARLEAAAFEVHEVSYGSRIGENTDVFDWPQKFRTQMDAILRCDTQDQSYSDDRRNQIVMFKSCFPNNNFVAAGTPPGNPAGPELTVANAQAAYTALLEEFQKQPGVLFVCLTAPPLAGKSTAPRWKQTLKKILGRPDPALARAALAREFNDWLTDQDGWLKNYTLSNVVVFDYYDILTGNGAANVSRYPTGDGFDSHPSHAGNAAAAEAFVPWLNRAVRHAGLTP